MIKGLEALIDLSQQHKISLTEEHRIECYEIIEKELKDYEKIKDIRITARFDLDQVNKEHKALEIIKEKEINVHFIKTSKNLKKYHYKLAGGFSKNKELTQEEYDLLKEVLL